MNKKKILLITAFFYPQNVVAVSRVGQWAKFWAMEGHEVTVLTTRKYPFWSLDNTVELPGSIRILEVAYLPIFIENLINKNRNKNGLVEASSAPPAKFAFLKSFSRLLGRYISSAADIHNLWISKATKLGLVLAKESSFDVMISSFSPAASHIVASNIKKKQAELLWVADFRDLWSDNHLNNSGGLLNQLEQLKEKKYLKRVDILTTVSEGLKDTLQKKYIDKRVSVIPNGFDPHEHLGWQDLIKRRVGVSNSITISYTGIIYPNKRDPTPLFMAINELIENGFLDAAQVRIDFYGNNRSALERLIAKTNANKYNIIFIHGQIPRKKSLDVQKNSDLLLFLEWNDKSASGVLTGKLFEYIVSGVPILGVGVTVNNAAGELIESSGTGVALLTAVELKEVIKKIISTKTISFYAPKESVIAQFSRDAQAQKLIKLVNEFSE